MTKVIDWEDKQGKHHKILEIMEDNDKWPIRLGIRKAEKILKNLDAVRGFVESHKTNGISNS